MKPSTTIATALTLVALSTSAFADVPVTLAHDGVSEYTIVTPSSPSSAVSTAARELSDDLFEMSGARLSVASTAPPGGHAIYVGMSTGASKAFPKAHVGKLPAEGYVVETSVANVLIAGADERGTLYGVYAFLEDQLGVGWFGPDATVIPKRGTVTVDHLHIREAPAFMMRDDNAGITRKSAAWDAHIRLNGSFIPDDPKYGGNYRLFNGDENFYELISPDKYFNTHPEYFSLIKGARSTKSGGTWGPGQLCLTNPDVFKIITDALADKVKVDPKLLTLGLSPNDSDDGNCEDAACKASDAKYGAPSGTLLNFVNKVAANEQARFPGRKIWVETLAYQYEEQAPKPGTIKPADNVLVCLCPIFACVSHPIDGDPDSVKSKKALMDWSKVAAGHLQIWHYATNFQNYLQPLPDFDELGPDMLYYKNHGVSGVFVEGDYQNGEPDLEPMRTWLLGHLLWNPHQDVWPLVSKFCDGYFGPAGPDMNAYVRLLHSPFKDAKLHMHIYDHPDAAYFPPALLASADNLFAHADSVATDPAIRRRVDRMHIGLRYVEIMQKRPAETAAQADQDAWKTEFNALIADVKKYDVTYITEGHSIDDALRRRIDGD